MTKSNGKAKDEDSKAKENVSRQRPQVRQSEVPARGLLDALRVPRAIVDAGGKKPTKPLYIAKAMGIQPTTGGFRTITGAAMAYGLTDAGAYAAEIGLTDLGRRAAAPTIEGDDIRAFAEAALKPRVIGEFLKKYDTAKLPPESIARNVLEDMGVPTERSAAAFKLILETADFVGFLVDMNGDKYVDLAAAGAQAITTGGGQAVTLRESPPSADGNAEDADDSPSLSIVPVERVMAREARVFLSHGKNHEIVEQIKTMLDIAEMQYEVAVEGETTAIPVSYKVLDAMRRCTAAVICVTADPADEGGEGKFSVNQNVLIEIGAAFVLYDKKVVLLWDKRVAVPSNLQGLYRCEFEGNEVSWSTGMKLMAALKKFKDS